MKKTSGFTPLQTIYFKRRSVTGFTLMELMIGVVILMICLTGLIATYVSCFDLNETMRNLSYAMVAAQEKMEEVRNYASIDDAHFDNVITEYNSTTFEIDDPYPAGTSPIADGDSKGIISVTQEEPATGDPQLLRVTIIVCWRQRGGRVIGGAEISGTLTPDPTSPARLVTLITKK